MKGNGMEITADLTTLLRQVSMTADEYMMHAITNIDDRLGQGYAKAHPELIGAFIQAAAIDMGTATIAKCVGSAIEEFSTAIIPLAEQLDRIADAIPETDPTSALGRIAEALQNIAAMLDLKVGGR
jgi:hypothetical protein